MDKIVVRHSRIEINNYELGDCPHLEYVFSIWDKVRHTRMTKAIEYDEKNKQLRIPRGVDIKWIESLFLNYAVVSRDPDPYINTEPIPIKYLTKDERQFQILKFLLGKDEYGYTTRKSQLAINSATGSGKTFVTIARMCYTGERIIIIINSLKWLNQWKEKIMEYTPLTEKDIYYISGTPSIDKLVCRNNPLQYQVFLASHATIKSYGDSRGWNAVEDLFKFLQVGLKVYDEAHLYFDNICAIDYHSNTKQTLYLTATPARSDQDENTIYQYYFKNVPAISLYDEDTDPHVDYIALHFNSRPSVRDVHELKNAYGFDRNKYANYLVKRPAFIKLVMVIIDMIIRNSGKALIYIQTNEAIKEVYSQIIDRYPWLYNSVGIYTSITSGNKEDNLKKKIILSTTKSTGAASDISDLTMVVNLAEPFKSGVLAQQTLGRCRGRGKYIDVIDDGFYYTKNYYNAKKPIFSRYALSCSDVYLTDDELSVRANNASAHKGRELICTRVFNQ